MIKAKQTALIFLIVHFLILLFICATWYKYNSNVSKYGGEMADGIFAILLFIATIYYFIFTVWTYRVYKRANETLKFAELQLGLIFVFSIVTAIGILLKLYF